MDCAGFENRFRRFLEGSLTPDERQAAEAHLSACAACRRLAATGSGGLDGILPPAPGELTRSILERTSGPACPRAREHLCDFVDGTLETGYAEILAIHLAGCAECSALSESLAELKQTLPLLSEIDPGLGFTSRVLQATAGRPVEPSLSPLERLRRWWVRLIQRPRFSWEAAYLGTIVLVTLAGNPLTTVDQLAVQVRESLQARTSVSLPSLALPGSLVSSETGALKFTREITGALALRQQEFSGSGARALERGAEWFRASLPADLEAVRTLRPRVAAALRQAWTNLLHSTKQTK